jgi:hypothetical protein
VPLNYAPEAPRLKKSWIKKIGTMQEYFKDFASQMAETFIQNDLTKHIQQTIKALLIYEN